MEYMLKDIILFESKNTLIPSFWNGHPVILCDFAAQVNGVDMISVENDLTTIGVTEESRRKIDDYCNELT